MTTQESQPQVPVNIAPAEGPLAVFLVGLGAIATTLVAGVEAIKRGQAQPIGSMTEMGTVRLGKRMENRSPRIKDFVPLARLEDLRFAAWDIYPDSAYDAAKKAGVLKEQDLEGVADVLRALRPMPAVFTQRFVKNISGSNVKQAATHWEAAEALKADIAKVQAETGATRSVMLWTGSTETYIAPGDVHATLAAFEQGLRDNHPDIAPSMVYAYAALSMGVPYANCAPNLTVDIPALQELAGKTGTPIAGKDLKTGQTLMKTVIAPGLKTRMLGVRGWFSTNILGNRDGMVLDDPGSFETKEKSKLSVLDYILQPTLYPELYAKLSHIVRINYYPPRGDEKEGWDNIDIVGWMGYPMQIKVNFLCRDSILAAPLLLDIARFLDLGKRAGMSGIQEWLSLFFKSPMTAPDLYPEHDLFIQSMKLKNTLRWMRGETLITHLGREYYE